MSHLPFFSPRLRAAAAMAGVCAAFAACDSNKNAATSAAVDGALPADSGQKHDAAPAQDAAAV